ncbi:hypothetical protein AB0I68_26100 [Streptomyces sp. NPDC050448]
MSDTVELTLVYVSDEGDDVEYTRKITQEGLTAVLMAMDDHEVSED